MKKANLSVLRSKLKEYVTYVKKGESIEIQDRNVSIARIVPFVKQQKNKTKLGLGKGTVVFKGDIIEPIMEKDWEVLS